MFAWNAFVPFEKGETCAVAVSKAFLKARGTAEIRRLDADRLVIAAHLPKQGLVIPATSLTYRYRLHEDRTACLVAIRWRGREYRDENARFAALPGGTGVEIDMLFEPEKGLRLAYRMVRHGTDAIEIDEVRGVPLAAGARIRLTRGAAGD